jgi:predicted enzyme related to lactoylglutathione lyase
MTTRERVPRSDHRAWADLWTSDIEGSRKFYSELFGWQAQKPSPDFGGFFMLTCNGVPTAGGMGDMGEMPATNTWTIHWPPTTLSKLLRRPTCGAQVRSRHGGCGPGPQATLIDPIGAHHGTRQPGTFLGFTVLNGHGPRAGSSCTRGTTRPLLPSIAVDTAGTPGLWATATSSATRLAGFRGRWRLGGDHGLQGFPTEGVPARRSICDVEDADPCAAKVRVLGGSVVLDAQGHPSAGWQRSPPGRLAPSSSCGPPAGSHAAE